MKNIPDKIYLQVDPEKEQPDNFNDLAEVTWCQNRIYDTDIPYYRRSSRKKIIKEFVEQVERLAEVKMLQTHKLEGAHYSAMKELAGNI